MGFPLLEAWLFKDEDRRPRLALAPVRGVLSTRDGLFTTTYIKIMQNIKGGQLG
jgi:hypothetical protein